MVQFNTKDNEILVKIVFYGPGLSGKTTNLQKLHELMDPSQKTDLFSVNTMEDRTLFFDLLPVDLGYVYGNSIKLQIYTVPGQVHYDSTRRIVLSGADGVIFVADSEKGKLHENVQSINNLYHNLQANRLNIKEIPLVLQFNKRDLPSALPVDVLNQKLNFRHVPFFEAVAIKGDGVLETFIEGVNQTVRYIFKKYQLSKNIKNVDSVIEKLEASIRDKSKVAEQAKEAATSQDVDQTFSPKVGRGGRTVLKYTHTIQDDNRSSQDKLLQKALTSNMETARLYSELKNSQAALMKKNEELSILYKQLEKTNSDNLKIRRFLESLVNFAGEAIMTFNDLWVIQNWNQAAEEMFNYPKKEIVNQNINVLFPENQMAELNKVLSFVVNGKAVKGFETRLLTKNGKEIPVNLTFSPIKNQNDTIIAFTVICRDLSFLKAIRGKILDLQKFESIGAWLPKLFDDIVKQLGTQETSEIDSLLQGGSSGKPNKKTKQLKRIFNMLAGVVHDSDALAEIQLNQIVEEMYLLVGPHFEDHNVDWITQLNPDLPTFEAPRGRLTHALLNLVLNALESVSSKEDAKVTIGTHFSGSDVLLQIIDNGQGLPPEDFDRMFAGLDADRDSVHHIRVNASRQIIRACGGLMRIDSSPGRGTKITIKFSKKKDDEDADS